MNNHEIAHAIATDLFEVGNERFGKTHRVQFRVGGYAEDREAGGLAFDPLVAVFKKTLDGILTDQPLGRTPIRTVIAALAMQSLARQVSVDIYVSPENVAKTAVHYADALLAELEKDNG